MNGRQEDADLMRKPYFTKFVVTKHHLKNVHLDLRIARENVAVSWAIVDFPTGPNNEVPMNRTKNHSFTLFSNPEVVPDTKLVDSGKCEVYQWDDPIIVHLRGSVYRGFYTLRHKKFNRWVLCQEDESRMMDMFRMIPRRGGDRIAAAKKRRVLQK